MINLWFLIDGKEFGIHWTGFAQTDWFWVDQGDRKDFFGGRRQKHFISSKNSILSNCSHLEWNSMLCAKLFKKSVTDPFQHQVVFLRSQQSLVFLQSKHWMTMLRLEIHHETEWFKSRYVEQRFELQEHFLTRTWIWYRSAANACHA